MLQNDSKFTEIGQSKPKLLTFMFSFPPNPNYFLKSLLGIW